MTHQHATLEDTVYFWFAANDTSGSGGDGASAAADVRLAGAAASAIPTLSPTPSLLSHANYPAGCYEVAVAATAGNGFAATSTYAVFCTLAVDSQNPSGFIGSFTLDPIIANVKELVDSVQSAADLKDFADEGYDPATNKVGGVALVDTTTANTDMVGTDGAALAANYTAARAGYLDSINGHTPQTGDSYARLGAPVGVDISADIADVPTVSEFNARTLLAASYFDPAVDTVATVTDVTNDVGITQAGADKVWSSTTRTLSAFGFSVTVGTNTDKTGYALSAAGVQAVWDALTSALTFAGSIGKLLVDNINTTISSRATSANVATELATYDGPTKAEMDARTILSASYFDPAVDNVIVGTNDDKTDYALSVANRQAMVDDILDEVISKSAHNDPNSVGKYIRRISSAFIWEGTAQGPGTGTNQIQLDTGASSVNGAYDPSSISIIDGTGAGQSRLMLQYDGPSRTGTLDRDWKVLPDATSEFIITPHAGRGHVNEGLAQGGTTNTITLNSLASPIDNAYNRQRVFIVSGAGADQVGRAVTYNGTTKVLTVAQTWGTIPDTTSGYVMLPDAPSLFQGYESAAIWIDTVNGTAGTVSYENGTAENPSSSLADATTLATNLGFSEFRVAPGSILTLTQSYNGFTMGCINSNGWTLNLGGQSISGTTIIGATVSGICSGASKPTFISCSMGAVTIPASRVLNCAITGTQTMSGSGDFFYEGCYSGIAGTGMWIVIFSASSNLNLRHYSGGVHAQSMAATNNMSLEGDGQLSINANCTGGTIAIRGHFTVTDNSGGAVTLSDNARIDIGQINAQADQALTDYDPPTNTQMNARTLLAASYATAAAQAIMQADLDNPNQYKADVSALALEATVAALNNISVSDILTTQMAESYVANGVAPTLAQALFQIQQSIGDFSISGVTITARKIDGVTTALTYTLNDSIDPTSRTRAT